MKDYISFNDGYTTSIYNKTDVKDKLDNIGTLQSKKVAWIRSDLSTSKSNRFSRMIWTVFVTYLHLDLIRSFYQVDLENSKNMLNQINEQLDDHPDLKEVFEKAVTNFNKIAPGHQFEIKKSEVKLRPTEKILPPEVKISEKDFQPRGRGSAYKDWKALIGENISITNAMQEAVGGKEFYDQLPTLDLSKLNKWDKFIENPNPLYISNKDLKAPIMRGINGLEGYNYLIIKVKDESTKVSSHHICFWRDGALNGGKGFSDDPLSLSFDSLRFDDYYALFHNKECKGSVENGFRLADQ